MRAIALLSVLLLSLAGCTSIAGGTAAPGAATSKKRMYGAPHVEHPLSIGRFRKQPCALLTRQQLAPFTKDIPLNPTPEPPSAGTPHCSYSGKAADDAYLAITPFDDGLARLYDLTRATGFLRVIAPVEGYPAVIEDTFKDETATVRCTVAVGVNDDEAVQITIDLSSVGGEPKYYGRPCDPAIRIAQQVMVTMREAS